MLQDVREGKTSENSPERAELLAYLNSSSQTSDIPVIGLADGVKGIRLNKHIIV